MVGAQLDMERMQGMQQSGMWINQSVPLNDKRDNGSYCEANIQLFQ